MKKIKKIKFKKEDDGYFVSDFLLVGQFCINKTKKGYNAGLPRQNFVVDVTLKEARKACNDYLKKQVKQLENELKQLYE